MINDSVLIKIENDPLSGLTREQFIDKVKTILSLKKQKNHIHKAFFFGSLAENQMSKFSDVDLIIVQDTDINFLDRFKDFAELFELGASIDLLVYTPQEWQKITNEDSLGFWKSVKSQLLAIEI